MTDSTTFLTLALHALARDAACQPPKISRQEALAELALDVTRSELRNLMETR